MGAIIGAFVLEAATVAMLSYFAAKLSMLKIQFVDLLLVIFIVSLLSLIPNVGWVLGFVVFIYLLHSFTRDPWVDCMWVAFLTKPLLWLFTLTNSTLVSSKLVYN